MVAELRTDEGRKLSVYVAQMKALGVVDGRSMLALVKAELADLEADFIDYTQETGIETVTLRDGTLVTRVDADRRKISADVLADLLPKSIFDIVTDPKVNHKRYDAAVEVGHIDPKAVAGAITVTPYSAIRVTNKSK